ncbi:MAG TPA: hypothetical protein VGK25_06040 [Ignavibacteria bacterium]|jgi:hypothetical protein
MNLNLFKLTLRSFFVLLVISLSFIGSDCDKTIISGGTTGDITGQWRLIYNAGTLNDICAGERVNFQSNGVANLTCPGNGQSIQRNYTVSGSTLTYTETNIQYRIVTLNNTDLELEGINNERYLYYNRVTTNDKTSGNSQSTMNNNSSEK